MKPYYEHGGITIYHGDCREVLPTLTGVDAIVTDPPYGLAFMGKGWDYGVPGVAFWLESARILKPGAHLLAFGGTRTFHRLACAIEDAGFEIRDCLSWLYGSGFPKSLDVSKAIDKAAGAERAVVATRADHAARANKRRVGVSWADDSLEDGSFSHPERIGQITAPATDAALAWNGWGTALKPAWEPIILARKPLSGTVAANVQAHGTGALNVDGCRVQGPKGDGVWGTSNANVERDRKFNASPGMGEYRSEQHPAGRWPANVVLDEEAARLLDEQSGERTSGRLGADHADRGKAAGTFGAYGGRDKGRDFGGDTGGASRFFYTAKADSGERHYAGKNTHPTVKPVDLMRWLCRLVTPKGGLILDPFMGSGSTGVAALAEGFRFIGIEREAEYVAIARRRIAGPLFAAEPTA